MLQSQNIKNALLFVFVARFLPPYCDDHVVTKREEAMDRIDRLAEVVKQQQQNAPKVKARLTTVRLCFSLSFSFFCAATGQRA